ncbi:energy transducer TonB [Hymenobacter terricola]|uniref:energy transducer TonB n=1 Tax=Hymenobacter terricola TaxID=2819236 RepID=UPI001B307B33|nr:energy transducer TonB [Hymenobacter terricola]
MLFAFAAVQPSHAQTTPPPAPEKVVGNKVYTYVEQMPQVPGGGGNRAIVAAIQSRVIYPPEALKRALQGQVFVSFTVGEDGAVRDAKIVKGLGGGCDETVLDAVRQLPAFTPGRQAGKPVAVNFTVPVTFTITGVSSKQRN